MPRGYPNSDRSNHWNDRWLPYLAKVALNVIRCYPGTQVDKHELINHAWINTARRAMHQYLSGKRRLGKRPHRPAMHTHDFAADHSDWLTAEPGRYVYDDVDQLTHLACRLGQPTRKVFLDLICGRLQKDIAADLNLTEGRLSQIVINKIRPLLPDRVS